MPRTTKSKPIVNLDPLEVNREYIRRARNNFMTFLKGLRLPSGYGIVPFKQVMQPHQIKCFEALAPNLEALQNNQMPACRKFWIERTKKAAKDSDLAAVLLWLLAFPRRPLYMQVGAADRDQAAIIKRRMLSYMSCNKWLEEFVKIHSYKANSVCLNASLDIMAADIQGSHGEIPDLLICNELSHVTKWEYIENLIDNAAGVPQGLVIIATNAGFKGTQAHVFREQVLKSPNWQLYFFKDPSPWMTAEDIAEAKERNTPSRYRRLFEGVWASGKGDAFDDELIERLFSENVHELVGPLEGWRYVMGMDLGVSRDHAGLLVLGINRKEQRMQIATCKGYNPKDNKTGEVQLVQVREDALALYRTFRCEVIGYDPHQAELMAQELRERGVRCVKVPFTGDRVTKMATHLLEVVRQGKLKSYEDPRLRTDLAKFNIVEKRYGMKLESVRDASGHADVGTALVISLLFGVPMMESGSFTAEDQLIFEPKPITKEDVINLPPALREIYDMEDRMARSRGKRPSLRDEIW